jgi:hypothetical protein
MTDIRCPPPTLQTFSGVGCYLFHIPTRSLLGAGPTSIEKKATSLGNGAISGLGPGGSPYSHRRGACGGAADTLQVIARERERERRCRKAKRS